MFENGGEWEKIPTGEYALEGGDGGAVARAGVGGTSATQDQLDEVAMAAIQRKDSGRAIDGAVRGPVEAQLGVGLDHARVHDDANAQHASRAMGARAFAHGNDVFLGAGESASDPALMAHELTHVAQQTTSGRANPQRKVTVGATNSPAEAQADEVAAAVTSGAPPAACALLCDDRPTAGQLRVEDFLARLEPRVSAVANAELGGLGSAVGCPYIVQAFAKYRAQPAAATLSVLQRWIPAARAATSIDQLEQLVLARVQQGVAHWRERGTLPADLAAAEPALAAQAQASAPTGAAGVQRMTLESLEGELGSGARVDGRVAEQVSRATGRDVSNARVHTGPVAAMKAAEHGATAFAAGNNIVMGSGAPPAGSAIGDALLAHELAHTAQQQDAAADPAARRTPIGDENQAAEQDAGLARLGNFAGAVGDVMRTGVQLQRCAQPAPQKVTELRGEAAKQKLADLGGVLLTDPDYSGGRKAVTGSHLRYQLSAPFSPTRQMGMYQWTHDGPDGYHMQSIPGVGRPDPIPSAAPGPNGMFVNAHSVGATTIPLNKTGQYTTDAWVRVGVDNNGVFEGYDLHVEHTVEAVPLGGATHRAYTKLGGLHGDDKPESFQHFHDTMDMQMVLLRPGGPEQQNKDHALHVTTNAGNPLQAAPGATTFAAHDARTDKSKPLTYHWYVSPQTKDAPPKELAGHAATVIGGRMAYDFGTGPSIAIPTDRAGFWVIWYQAKDASGADAGEASYLQTILGSSEMQELEKYDKYMDRLDELGGKIQGAKVPVTGVHVSQANANETRLRLFIGKQQGDPSKFILIDGTPGLDPEANRLEYTSSSGRGVIDEFIAENKYPKGQLKFRVAANGIGIPTSERTVNTDGQGFIDRLSTGLSVGGMAVMGLGLLAAPFTRGQSLQVAMVVASAATAAGSALSLYERLQHAEVSKTGVALDVVMIASSIINGGAAIRSLKSGPAVLVANRATRFLLWSNFIADGVSALLISVEGAHQLAQIMDNDKLTPEQKRSAVVRVVTNLVMAGTMLAMSHGQLREFRDKLNATVGKTLAKELSDDVCMTLSMLDNTTLKGLATTKDASALTKLAGALREEPALINVVKAHPMLGQALPLMKASTADDLRFAIMRANAHSAGVSVANSERLLELLRSAKVEAGAAMQLPKPTLAQLGRSGLLDDLDELARLAASGKVTSFDSWVKGLVAQEASAVERSAWWANKARTSAAHGKVDMLEQTSWGVDPSMRLADEKAGLIVNGAYVRNPKATELKSLLTASGKIGSKQMSGQFMYVVSEQGTIIIGTRAGQRMPHPTLIGGANPTVLAAGIVDIRGGKIYSVNNASGHFKPGGNSLSAAKSAFDELPKTAFHKDFQGYVSFE